MNRVVQTPFGLKVIAATLRVRHDENVCTCPCTGDCNGGQTQGATAYPEWDARERKRAAQKLLRPIEDKAGYEDFTIEEWLEVALQSWEMCLGRDDLKESSLKQFQFSARQLKYTTAHARTVWDLSSVDDRVDLDESAAEVDEFDIDWIKAATGDDDGDYDASDLFDWDVSDLEVNFSSDPDNEPPHDMGKDAGGNEAKIY